MSWSVSIRPAAARDLRAACNWYETQRPGLGDQFLQTALTALLSLENSPERFPIYYNGFRRILTPRFPYKIFFRVEGASVIVFRMLHAARDHTSKDI